MKEIHPHFFTRSIFPREHQIGEEEVGRQGVALERHTHQLSDRASRRHIPPQTPTLAGLGFAVCKCKRTGNALWILRKCRECDIPFDFNSVGSQVVDEDLLGLLLGQ